MKCRACGCEEEHNIPPGAYCSAIDCLCTEPYRQLAALRAGLDDISTDSKVITRADMIARAIDALKEAE